MRPEISVVAGLQVKTETKAQEVIRTLRDLADEIERGDRPATGAIAILWNETDPERVNHYYSFTGRTMDAIAALEVAKVMVIRQQTEG